MQFSTHRDECLTDIETLVRQAQSGDRQAFGKLVDQFQPIVFSIGMSYLRHHEEALDLCQSTFLQAWAKIGQLQVPKAFPGWLKQITIRLAINRKARERQSVSLEPDLIMRVGESADDQPQEVLLAERAAQVKEGLARLPNRDRQTLIAFYFDGHSVAEMAEMFMAPVGTIKRRLHTARRRLKAELPRAIEL